MRLNIVGLKEYIHKNAIANYWELSEELGLSVEVIKELEQGGRIGYDAVKDMYNRLGEKTITEIIDFEEDTLEGFKSKYVLVGNTLY